MVEIIEKYFVLCKEKVLFQQSTFYFLLKYSFLAKYFLLVLRYFFRVLFYFVTKYWNKVTTPAV